MADRLVIVPTPQDRFVSLSGYPAEQGNQIVPRRNAGGWISEQLFIGGMP
jgi:hypothetical protein